jgi:voltage-gated potassium channel
VGYGEVRPVETPALKVFTISLILAGCSAGLRVVGSVVEFMAVRTAAGEIHRNPHGNNRLEAGDTIILIGRRGDLPKSLRKAVGAAAITYRGSKM